MDFERTVSFHALGTSLFNSIQVSLCIACLEKEAKEKVPRFEDKD